MALFLIAGSAAPTAAGEIAGTVEVAELAKPRRSFRGAAYRGVHTEGAEADTATVSRFASVVVSAHPLSFVPAVEPLADTPRMEQVGAQFTPRVLPVTVGSRVAFVNRDPFYHNVFSLSKPHEFDIGRRPAGEVVEQVFDEPAVVSVFCDIHPQMNATILVLDTPYFTQPDSLGAFRLTGLPDGDYTLRFFHPTQKTVERRVTVDDATPVQLRVDFTR